VAKARLALNFVGSYKTLMAQIACCVDRGRELCNLMNLKWVKKQDLPRDIFVTALHNLSDARWDLSEHLSVYLGRSAAVYPGEAKHLQWPDTLPDFVPGMAVAPRWLLSPEEFEIPDIASIEQLLSLFPHWNLFRQPPSAAVALVASGGGSGLFCTGCLKQGHVFEDCFEDCFANPHSLLFGGHM
jgi:hypothetical protein